MENKKNKLTVIVGPTASGKTGLAVNLCQKFNGEVVSADSRQVYEGMDIGTGKDLAEYKIQIKNQKSKIKIIDIPYHMIDVASPKKRYNLADYQKGAFRAIDEILKRERNPFLVGGTGLYVQAVIDNYDLSADVKTDERLRKKLEMLSVEKLIEKFQITNRKFQINPKSKIQNAKHPSAEQVEIQNSLQNNRRRIIRYIEMMEQKKKPFNELFAKDEPRYDPLILGLTFPKDVLAKRIKKRLKERLEKEDMLGEVRGLKEKGLSWKRLEEFGLEYKWLSLHLKGKISYEEMFDNLNRAINQFAKRQMTWFKRDKRIKWIENKKEAEKLVREFLK